MSNFEIRAKAREQLGGNIFKNEWLILALIALIVSALIGVLSCTVVGSILIVGIAEVSLAALTLKKVRSGEAFLLDDLLYSVKDGRAVRSILLGFLTTLFVFLWSMLFIIPGIVKSYSYAMTYFISLDRPELEANDCITASRKLMDGKKLDLFFLDLSFLGWYILGALCFGVGTVFVAAYHLQARANFYQQLILEKGIDTSK